ncbi:MAG: flagellar biosynthesis protein FlhB [Planctomycetes bacterium]|nr:flagellar biosynthesis protein FlhB [Planctomycetota bacterium]
MPADVGEKTEPPTARRRTEARNNGQVARSQDLVAAALMLAGFLALYALGPRLWGTLLAVTTTALAPIEGRHEDAVLPFAMGAAVSVFKELVPFLLILMATATFVLFIQVGPLLTLKPITPSLSKLNPLKGIARLFSLRSLVQALTNVAKLLLIGTVAYVTIRHAIEEVVFAQALSFGDVFRLGAALVFRLAMALAVAMLILALLDYAYQRYQHTRDMRMTKEEVKDELRSMEGDPAVKRKRRQIQLQMAMQRIGSAVPEADVVVTNPTHLAIAIRYEHDTMTAPRVVAKGADHLALRIRQIAEASGVPIVERKSLVRMMYDVVEVGETIPERFYQAIAEILAYVYELAGGGPRGIGAATAES